MRYFILKEKKLPEDINFQKGNYRVIEKKDENNKKIYLRIDEFSDKRSEIKIKVENLDSIHNYKGNILRGCLNSECKILVYKDIFNLQEAYLICKNSPPIGLKLQEIENLEDEINKFVISD